VEVLDEAGSQEFGSPPERVAGLVPFFRKVLLFLAVAIVLIAALVLLLGRSAVRKAQWPVDAGTRIIFMGHSHPQCAYDDALIPGARNIAHSSEPWFYTTVKCREVLAHAPALEAVFVEFTANQLLPARDSIIWDIPRTTVFQPHLQHFLTLREMFFLFQHAPANFLQGVSMALRQDLSGLRKPAVEVLSTIAGYAPQERNDLQVVPAADRMAAGLVDIERANRDLRHLEELVALCEEAGVRVILLRSPLHPSNPLRRLDPAVERLRLAHFPKLPWLDLQDFPLPDAAYADISHLNHQGANRLSHWFNELLEAGLLETDDLQDLVHGRMPDR
jgi:hypothetical protein